MPDYQMPSRDNPNPEAEENFDFGFDEETSEEGTSVDLKSVSDEDLFEEMKSRGFEIEETPEEEGTPEAGPEMEEPI